MALRFWPRGRAQQITLGFFLVLFGVAFVAAFFLDEPIRRHVESQMNARLKGYTVRIAKADFHPIGFSVDFENSTVVQQAHPEPPVAEIPSFTASVQWLSLLRLRLVANFRFDEPKLFLVQKNFANEWKDDTPIQEKGWQEALQEAYPLKINEFEVNDGQVTYTPDGNFKPLVMTQVNLKAENIRNIRSKEREYPSDVHMDAVLFEDAALRVDGNADFLAAPHLGIKTDIDLRQLPLSYLTGVIHDYATIRKGSLSGHGVVEYAPTVKQVLLEEVSVTGADADYTMTAANKAESKEIKKKTIEEAKQVSGDRSIVLRAKDVRITNSTVGWVNTTETPDYRLYVSNLDVRLKDFSNQKNEGIGTVNAKGKFNGTGTASIDAVFKPETKSPNFDLAVKIEDTDLRNMNNLLRAKSNLDVTKGFMGFFSEMKVRNNHVDGYVKVLFHDVDVYDKAQDRHKPFMKKAYEVVAEGVANLLENRKTDDTATRANISGPIENPNSDIWQIIGNLVRNAFFEAILPGLEGGGGDAGNIVTGEPAGSGDEAAGAGDKSDGKDDGKDNDRGFRSRLREIFDRDDDTDGKDDAAEAKDRGKDGN